MPRKKKPDTLIPLKEVAARLGCTIRRVHRFIDLQELHPQGQDSDGAPLFDVTEVSELHAEEKAPEAQMVIQQLTSALKDAQEHINSLVKLVVDPTKQTTDAILKALTSSTDENQKLQAERRETLEMYVTLLKESELFKVEVQRVESDMKLKQEAFELLKEQVPIIVSNLSVGTKLLNSFPTAQIEALLGNAREILTAEQISLFERVLAERKVNGKSEPEKKEDSHDSTSS